MNLGLVKSAVQLVVGYGVGLIVDEGVKVIKPKNVTGLKKTAVKLGGLVMSYMVAHKATDYVGQQWDQSVDGIKKLVARPEKDTEEKDTEEKEETEIEEVEES